MIYFSPPFFGDQTQVGTPYVDTIVCLFFWTSSSQEQAHLLPISGRSILQKNE